MIIRLGRIIETSLAFLGMILGLCVHAQASERLLGLSMTHTFTSMNRELVEVQKKSELDNNVVPDDSLYVFESPRSLLSSSSASMDDRTSMGGRLLISGNGYGAGMFYQYDIDQNWTSALDLVFSGARNTSELEAQDPSTGIIYVPGKANRVFMIPLSLNLSYRLFRESLAESLRPFVSVGIGPTAIIAAPYDPFRVDFISSFGSAKTYLRAGGFVGIGAYIRNTEKSYISLDARYYIVPVGGQGIESIRNRPMKDLNGLFVALAIGFY